MTENQVKKEIAPSTDTGSGFIGVPLGNHYHYYGPRFFVDTWSRVPALDLKMIPVIIQALHQGARHLTHTKGKQSAISLVTSPAMEAIWIGSRLDCSQNYEPLLVSDYRTAPSNLVLRGTKMGHKLLGAANFWTLLDSLEMTGTVHVK